MPTPDGGDKDLPNKVYNFINAFHQKEKFFA